MKIKLNPTIELEIPDKFKQQVDLAKFHRYCQYDKERSNSFEAQLCDMAFTRFITYCIASAISDTLSEQDVSNNWIDIASELSVNAVEIEWTDL